MRLTILGGGCNAFALAFHLAQQAHDICLYVHPEEEESVREVRESNQIVAVRDHDGAQACLHGTSMLSECTTNMEDAIDFSDLIIMCVPVDEQMKMFRAVYPWLDFKKVVFIVPGAWASLQFATYMESEMKELKRITFVETSSVPYICKRVGKNQVFIQDITKGMQVGVIPCEKTGATMWQIRTIFSKITIHACANVLGPALMNMDVPTILLYMFNNDTIEKSGKSEKADGESKSKIVVKLADAVDKERNEVADEFGNKCLEANENIQFCTGINADDACLYKRIMDGKRFWKYCKLQTGDVDSTMTEDLEYYFLPILDLARLHGNDTPVMKAVANSAEELLRKKLSAERNFKFIVREGEGEEKILDRLKWWHGFM